jgi:hypothetical protein
MYNKYTYEKYDNDKMKEVFNFNEGYKTFLTHSKTERLAVKNAIALAEEKGFKDISTFQKLKAGDKVYVLNRKKNIALFIIGKEDMEKGINVLGAHIDSPRIDAKQNPLYESQGFVLLDTHYYGGIKKYQFVARPLAIYGVICKKDGTVVDVAIGDDANDPIVGISDLLIHLSQEQLQKPASTVIEGENLDVTLGSWPTKGDKEDSFDVKKNILNILKEKYGIEEEDLSSAELEIVPAGETRDYGLDRSMVAGYGHDDRVCAYTSLMAILDLDEIPARTSCCILVDKEEIGSVGATGAQSRFFENAIAEVMDLKGEYSPLKMQRLLTQTKMLSSDVSAGVDPLFLNVNELKNSAYLNKGLVFNKYTGARGKNGCNDANPEYFAMIRNILDNNNVSYQTAELGRVDLGGGGTIAGYLGNLNMDVIDAGVAVLNMHAPMEIVSKVDVYEAYRGYSVFLKEAK